MIAHKWPCKRYPVRLKNYSPPILLGASSAFRLLSLTPSSLDSSNLNSIYKGLGAWWGIYVGINSVRINSSPLMLKDNPVNRKDCCSDDWHSERIPCFWCLNHLQSSL